MKDKDQLKVIVVRLVDDLRDKRKRIKLLRLDYADEMPLLKALQGNEL
jgi:hypothetical protein